HFHTAVCADKKNFDTGLYTTQCIRDCNRWIDMPACTSSAYDYSMRHISCFLLQLMLDENNFPLRFISIQFRQLLLSFSELRLILLYLSTLRYSGSHLK